MVEYNGKTAVVYGMLMALVAIVLWWWIEFVANRDWSLEWTLAHTSFVRWSLCFAYLVAGLVMFFSRPDTSVFLDQICIKQDNEMKMKAIFSLAGIIKKSDKMLILWDPSWTERLWCLVELAAFLKSRQNPREQLTIRPIFLGPVSLAISLTALGAFVTLLPAESYPTQRTILLPPLSYLTLPPIPFLLCALIVPYAGVSALRSYFRALEDMKWRLKSILFDETRCYCCDRNHVSLSGKPMLCDRMVFIHCMDCWFGGREVFEDIVHSKVRKRMIIDLEQNVFSSKWILATTTPFLWGYLVLGVSEAISVSMAFSGARGHMHVVWVVWDNAQSHLLDGFGIWLLFPQFVHLIACVCKHTQSRPESHCLEFAKNAAIVVALSIPIFGVTVCIVWINDYTDLANNAEAWQ